MPEQLKQSFLLNEFWMLSIGAAFQRARVYKKDTLEKDRNAFKQKLRAYISDLAQAYLATAIDDNKHIENIHSIISFSKQYSSLLTNESLNFGVSQKLFNLYLKYLWCLDMSPIHPPHFPVDRIIQQKLECKNLCAWTQMSDETEYARIIDHARDVAKAKGFETIADLELNLFKRKN